MAHATTTRSNKLSKANARLQVAARARGATTRPRTSAADRRVRQMIGLDPTPAAGLDVAAVRRLSGLSQAEFARVSGYSTRAVAGWEAGAALAEPARRRIIELRRLFRALAELMPANELGNWLRKHNAAFEDLAPMHVIERGESDRLWEMIHQIDANVAN